MVVLAVGDRVFPGDRQRGARGDGASATGRGAGTRSLTANRVKSEVSPEIESLRAQVERQSAEQRLINVTQSTGERQAHAGAHHRSGDRSEIRIDRSSGLSPARRNRSLKPRRQEALAIAADLASAEASVHAANPRCGREKAQRLPVVSVSADYGGGGANFGNFNQVYTVSGNVSVPIYTGGRIRADIEQARGGPGAARRRNMRICKGRIAYDVRVALAGCRAPPIRA